jgi:predicted alpha/beta-hydrolase family hydrolase
VTNSRSPEPFPVALDQGQTVTAMHYAAARPGSGATFILAHGAGAGQQSTFIVAFAHALADRGFDVVTFNFPYTEQRRRIPDRAPVLESCFAAVIDETRRRVATASRALFIGGKSMGGRMATQLAAARPDLAVTGLALLGYPLHPPGQPAKRRDAHLPAVKRPMLVVQGSRDTFGTRDEVVPVFEALVPAATVHVVEGGDHSFKVGRPGSDRQVAVDEEVRDAVAGWMRAVTATGAATPPPPQ